MTEIIFAIVGKIAEHLVDPIIHHGCYLFRFNRLVGNFRKEKTEFQNAHLDMKERTKIAIRNAEKLVRPVEQWLNDAEKVLEDVHKLKETEGASKSCLNLKLRYSQAKQVESMTQQMNELTKKVNELNKNKISEPIELPRMEYFSSKDFMSFDSRKSIYDKLLMAIQDDKGRIGLVGMGGSGKTTLVKEVGKQAEKLKLFDKVVMATVSQNPNVRVIQGEIADQLSFKFKQETTFGRAQQLSKRLETEKILIILDDMWEKLDLEVIGIPLNCSILLTTRWQDVCTLMDCQTIIQLHVLTENEGWNLFKKCAQINDDSPHLREVAKKIAHKCQGLPIAIVTVGSMLKGRAFNWWESTLSKLESSQPIDVPKGLTSPYVCLKLSYDNLTNQLAKSIFLLCCMFPDDHEIHMDDLVQFGRGMLQEPDSMDLGTMATTRKEFNIAINTLIDCYLLMPTEKKEYVKMHDMVRDTAMWIASNEGQAIMVANKEIPMDLKDVETIKGTMVISLWNLKTHVLPHQLFCPTLKILINHISNEDKGHHEIVIPKAYLEGKKDLKVLAFIAFSYTWNENDIQRISGRNILKIPKSIGSLSNLRTLCLRGYKLGDISVLGSIKGIEILDMRGSSFIELPIEIAASKKLKILDLYLCEIHKGNPFEVITKCLVLQELYISAGGDYSLENVSFPKLQRYHIWLSKTKVSHFKHGLGNFHENCEQRRYLHVDLEGSYASALNDSSLKDLILRAEGLYLRHFHEGYKNIFLDMDKQHINGLTYLALESCSGIKYLIDTSTFVNNINVIQSKILISKLAFLCLENMHDLEDLFRDPSSGNSTEKLQDLTMSECPQLCSISFPRNLNLCSLKRLTLTNCPKLAHALFTPSIAQTLVALEELGIEYCENLKYIIAEDMEEGKEHWLEIETSMPALKTVALVELPNLIGICPVMGHVLWVVATSTFGQLCNDQVLHPTLQAFLNLECLYTLTCNKLEGIFELQVEEEALVCNTNKEQAPLKKLTSKLRELWCSSLFGLRFIWNGPANILCLQRLDCVFLEDCPKLKTIFSATIVPSLPALRRVDVKDCNELEKIIDLDSDSDSDSRQLRRNLSAPNSQQVCFPKLWSIEVIGCDKLKCIFSYSMASHCPALKSLKIESCSHLEEVVKFEHKEAADVEGGEDAEHGKKHVLFPKLTMLELKNLPNLTRIFPGYEFNSHHKIQDCPKYKGASIST